METMRLLFEAENPDPKRFSLFAEGIGWVLADELTGERLTVEDVEDAIQAARDAVMEYDHPRGRLDMPPQFFDDLDALIVRPAHKGAYRRGYLAGITDLLRLIRSYTGGTT